MEISYEEFLGLTKELQCHYCGASITWVAHPTNDKGVAYNLDRKDNDKGYTLNNVVVCCKLCNYTKANRFSYDEFRAIGDLLRFLRPVHKTREDMPYFHTYWGKKFVHQYPLATDVCIEDIAHSLSQICRFAGMVKWFYSVAEHSVRVSYMCAPEHQLWALLHDASEAYCNDLTRPLKYSDGMWAYRQYEALSLCAVCESFGLRGPEPLEVKKADRELLLTEKRDLFLGDHRWTLNKTDNVGGILPLMSAIEPWSPEQAKNVFLMRFYELTGCREFYKER